jgi:predicted transcriptional regulator
MLEHLIMQSPTITTTTGIDAVISLLVAGSALIGTLGGLITGIVSYIRSHTNSKEIQTASDRIIDVSKLATDFAQKTAEQEDKFKNIGEVITQLSPQAKQLLESKQMQVEKLTKDVEIAKAQLNRLKGSIPAEGQADSMPDLPRQ